MPIIGETNREEERARREGHHAEKIRKEAVAREQALEKVEKAAENMQKAAKDLEKAEEEFDRAGRKSY